MAIASQMRRTPSRLILLVLGVFSIGPLVELAFSSLKSPAELSTNPLGWPRHFHWSNYSTAWTQADMGRGMINSLIVVGGTVIGVVIIAGLAGYALARLPIPGRAVAVVYLLVSSALPIQVFLVPLFFLWTKLGLYDSRIGLIIIYWGLFSPFATLLVRAFIMQTPPEYEDAARVDGAGELTVLTRIVLPISWPAIMTAGLVVALWAWNEFLIAVTFLQNPAKLPASLAFFSFEQGYSRNYTLISAAGVTLAAPMLVLFIVLQRRFIAGLSSSGLKG
jgi:raffinose/stachyose/melibiose transport system permease protein